MKHQMGPVESVLQKNIEKQGCIHLALFDPEKSGKNLRTACSALEKLGTTGIMVGGSTVASTQELDETIKTIKDSCSLPAILFPNGLSGISRFADAIFFMSLLNSTQTHYITGAQALGAPVVKRFKLETIPLGYILVGESSTAVSSISRAELIPYSKPEVAASYALAAQYFGMRYVYLEAGSGATRPVDASMVRKVSSELEIPLIVGGGIRTPEQAQELASAGASAIVTGTVLEKEGTGQVAKIVAALGRA
jgi:phosphoglycerol geranylgeranyltransferase